MKPAAVLLVGAAGGRVTLRTADGGSTDLTPAWAEGPATLAAAIADETEEVVVAVDAAWVSTARLDAADLPAKGRDDYLLSRLEAAVGTPAEDLVAVFVGGGGDAAAGSVLAVAVEREPWAGVAEALRAAGVRVRALSPTPLLAAEALSTAADVLLVGGDDGRVEVLTAGGGWRSATLDASDNRLDLALRDAAGDGRVTVAATPADAGWDAAVDSPAVASLQRLDLTPDEAAANVAAGGGRPAVDLLVGPLAAASRGAAGATRVAWAVAAALALVAAGGLVLMMRAGSSQAEALAAQEAAYREVSPAGPVPANVPARLRALQREADAGGRGGDAVRRLAEVLRAMPDDTGVRVTDVDVRPAAVSLTGQADAMTGPNELAESLTEALRPGLRFAVLSSTRDDGSGRVTFSIEGTPPLARRSP